jgi:hypothetical protein
MNETMSETTRKYSEAAEQASERLGRASGEAADVLSSTSGNAINGLQNYNEKLLEIAQSNIDATFKFLRRAAVAKSPSEFIAAATEHANRQYETSSQQAKELTALAQKMALWSTEPVTEYAAKTIR